MIFKKTSETIQNNSIQIINFIGSSQSPPVLTFVTFKLSLVNQQIS